MQAKQKTEMVTFDLPEYKRITAGEVDGCEVTLEYDSSFGGIQTVSGTAEKVREWENGRRVSYMVVAGRKVSNGCVFSANDGRQIGKVESVTVTMDFDTALKWVAKDWSGHDVDRHTDHDEIYVQFWSGRLNDEMSQEEWFNHTGAIRFQL